jgi:flagella basal body P-ring formation protein FlgA
MLAITLILGSFVGLLNGPDEILVFLKKDADVRDLEVRLGDIAEITGTDTNSARKLSALPLAAAPAPGEGRILTTAGVEALLRRAAPEWKLHFAGAEAVRIRSEEVRLAAADVQLLARRALMERLGAEAATARILSDDQAQDLRSPAGRFTTSFEAVLPKGAHLQSRIIVRVQALVDGVPGAHTDVTLQLFREVDVLVAARTLSPGKAVSVEDVRMQRLPSASVPSGALATAESILGLIPDARLESGRVLSLSDFRRPPLVHRGDAVITEIQSGRLTVRGEAIADGSGAAGDVIQVRTRPGNKALSAEVIDERTVRVRTTLAKEIPR